MPVKIDRLEIENVKRVKAVLIEPTKDGLTIVGGRNGQGKTSVLDAITWALGGDRFKPSKPTREGSVTPPRLKVTLSNGLVVERKGPNSALSVRDPEGSKGGQQLLNEFVEQFALDLPRFMNSSAKEKASTLLRVIGVGDVLYELETAEERLYNKRRNIGQIADQKRKAADEAQSFPDAPSEPVSASELIQRQQAILAKNGENQRLRENVAQVERRVDDQTATIIDLEGKAAEISRQLDYARGRMKDLLANLETAKKTAEQLADESTAEIEASIASIDETNVKVRANQAKSLLDDEANAYTTQYDELTEAIEDVRSKKLALLQGADLPLEGLSVEGGELTYNGCQWDSISGSEQLRIGTAIVRKLNPGCGFVLLDKLEQMDLETLHEFGDWVEGQGLQVIATRVSTGEECSIVIEDGYAVAENDAASGWKAGEF